MHSKSGLRLKRRLVNTIHGISKQDIRRCARRAGSTRLSENTIHEAKLALKTYLQTVIRTSYLYTEHARRNTMTTNDVVHGLKRLGTTLYGFD